MCFTLIPPHLTQSRTSHSVLMCRGNVTRTASFREQACEELVINLGKEKTSQLFSSFEDLSYGKGGKKNKTI